METEEWRHQTQSQKKVWQRKSDASCCFDAKRGIDKFEDWQLPIIPESWKFDALLAVGSPASLTLTKKIARKAASLSERRRTAVKMPSPFLIFVSNSWETLLPSRSASNKRSVGRKIRIQRSGFDGIEATLAPVSEAGSVVINQKIPTLTSSLSKTKDLYVTVSHR